MAANADQPPALPPPVANAPNADPNGSGINGNFIGRVSPLVAGGAAQLPPQNNHPEDGLPPQINQQQPHVLLLPLGVDPPTVVAPPPLFRTRKGGKTPADGALLGCSKCVLEVEEGEARSDLSHDDSCSLKFNRKNRIDQFTIAVDKITKYAKVHGNGNVRNCKDPNLYKRLRILWPKLGLLQQQQLQEMGYVVPGSCAQGYVDDIYNNNIKLLNTFIQGKLDEGASPNDAMPTQHSTNPEEKKLGKLCVQIRGKRKNTRARKNSNKLSNTQITQLDGMGFVWDPNKGM